MAKLVENLGNYTATIEVLPPGEAKLYWHNSSGKRLRLLPKVICKKYQTEYSNIKEKFKSIRETLRIQTKRIESFYLDGFKIPFNEWWRYYVEHPLINSISSGLIWNFENNTNIYSAIIKDKKLVMADGSVLPVLPDTTLVSLWHPLLSDVDVRDEWRSYVWNNGMIQPFRQAFREVYIESPENDYQLLIKGLFVRQHQFRALLIARGWRYQLRGHFYSESCPELYLKNGVSCEIGIVGQSTISSRAGISLAVELEDIRFRRNGKLLSRSELKPLEYSEVVRDIDFFVSVSALGYKKDWEHIEEIFADVKSSLLMEKMALVGGQASIIFNDFMLENDSLTGSITELLLAMEISMKKLPIPGTVKTRAVLLDLMLRESKIARLIKIDGRYVHIDVAHGSYRINLASGLVFSAIENRLLPITTQKITITNEATSDTLLSRIYGLILMLAMKKGDSGI